MSRWPKEPIEIEVNAGERRPICVCLSSNIPPYCDGTHKKHIPGPNMHTFERGGTHYICGCGLSRNRPLCDGSHKNGG